ncbi:uncharacterized protein LOC135805699 [Sycon ciliatum]|uniref:uncharacterized protein LOC135805699 n=1 Tax=Sycon ciliatum TaxID=27933 RepID=UPI0020AD23A3|eukprot:scpid85306/ scgid32622/ 
MAALIRRLVCNCRVLPSRGCSSVAQEAQEDDLLDSIALDDEVMEVMELEVEEQQKRRAVTSGSEPTVPHMTSSDQQISAHATGVSPWLQPVANAAWVPRPAMTPFYIYMREYEEGTKQGFLKVVMERYREFNKLPARVRAQYEELSLLDEQRFYEEMDVYMTRADQRSLLSKLRHEERRTINTHVARSVGAELADLKFRTDEIHEELDTQQQQDGWALA